MMSQLLHMEIPNFGSTVLDSLNEQRLLGQHCDVAIMVNGQAFKAHRAVLAASSLYFRDLFSGSTQTLFELPSSVAPSCFRQILSFCYTGRMTVSASDQLMVMYTAGYLQIQNIVERGMDLMFKTSAPYCDSQTSATDDPPSPNNNNNSSLLLGDHTTVCKIKEEKLETSVCAQSAEQKHAEEDRGTRGRSSRMSTLFYNGGGGNGVIPVMHPYEHSTRDHASPGASSLPTTDSPTSHQNEEEDFEDDSYESLTNGKIYGGTASLFGIQEKMEVSSLPLSLENRFCVLLGGDREALPAGLISQIGYRCHPALYTEGDPGERLELIGGSGVFMTRGQLMNCHLCAGVKHKVLLRRLLAAFFDRNTLADSCGTGIRSSNCDPNRKPLDSRILNTVKLYCQNFAPNFKESEMNVIAADMCTNARRVRKRWLPKIKSMLPEAIEVYRGTAVLGQVEGATQPSGGFPFESEFKHLTASNLTLEQHLYGDCRETLRNSSHFTGVSIEERSKGEAAKPEPGQARESDNPQDFERLPESPERAASVLALNPASKKGEKERAASSPRTQRGTEQTETT
ncbi:nucleus accumbens-associated protein 2-like [Myxocyprinus asiaticus]|uniref:nucleus accumbens-associated protein 2-like n=1 Tax=Myxocyprinus asiaticus TaxID=70543 RepID=UPI0022224A2B|nr:nucleus accumbens-associated protein 2-like [Myxocyprinus asiaticus]XP_051551716.1 nucleus accumbens-associated protein 2-like [Myxocyprinus asiaticus]